MKPPLKNSTVLITGASSGMGKELAKALARDAKTIVLVARQIDPLQQLASELRSRFTSLAVHALPCDLTNENAMHTLCQKIQNEVGDVDVLVNNAGVGQIGNFETASIFTYIAN